MPSGASDQGGVIHFEIGDVATGESGSLTYTATLLEGAEGAVENNATMSSELADANPGDNQASARFDVVLHPAELRLVVGV